MEQRLQTALAEEMSTLSLVRTSHGKKTDGAFMALLYIINQLGFVSTSWFTSELLSTYHVAGCFIQQDRRKSHKVLITEVLK